MAVYYYIYKIGLLRFLLLSNGFSPAQTSYAVITIVAAAVCIISGYLLGGLNFAIILSKKKFGVDVRDFGSGNAGSTNMLRTFGKKAGAITLAGDAGKAIIACLIGCLLLGLLGAYIAGLFSVLGHMFPIKYKFKGGKGVACTAAVILMTTAGNPYFLFVPIVFLIALVCFIVIVAGTKYVSLASIMSVAIYPLILNAFISIARGLSYANIDPENPQELSHWLLLHSEDGFFFVIALIIAIFVVFMHRENIKRLWNKKENKFSFHSKKTLYEEKNAPENETDANK